MAYIKQVWQDGETICNEERMNHIENGIANSLTTEDINKIKQILKICIEEHVLMSLLTIKMIMRKTLVLCMMDIQLK